MTSKLTFSTNVSILIGFLLVAFFVFILGVATAHAEPENKPANQIIKTSSGDESKGPNTPGSNNKPTPAKVNSGDEVYNYVAQQGDSYTLMARKAVQTYGLEFHTKLSGAQIIFCETNLTQSAGSPFLNLGQKVSFSVGVVKSWIEKAEKLDSTQITAWNYYVQFVDFNTNAVGQPN